MSPLPKARSLKPDLTHPTGAEADEVVLPITHVAFSPREGDDPCCQIQTREVPDDGLPERILRHIWKKIWHLTRPRGWRAEHVDEAAQEVVLLLIETRGLSILNSFVYHKFDTIEYIDAKAAIQRTVNLVLDRAREQHKIEIKQNSIEYDMTVDAGKRQRRILPRNKMLGENDRQVIDNRDDENCRDLVFDVAVAMDSLPAEDREIVIRRVEFHQSWRTIALELRSGIRDVKRRYDRARRTLAWQLRPYDEPLPDPRVGKKHA
jgi:DNA-directed RNA polymerase specialized sigma24 family protein